MWIQVRSQIPEMRKKNKVIQLTSNKKIYSRTFNSALFVCFEQTWSGRDGEPKCTFINFNQQEWRTFVMILSEIDAILPPGPIAMCFKCYSSKRHHTMINGCLSAPELTVEEQQKVELENSMIDNQMGMRCDYCGQLRYFDCHCHKFDCKECSPDNFCENCGDNYYYPV